MNNQDFDYNKLLRDAQIRWLKPAEIQYILQNHERYPIAQATPQQPPSGSVFLFNKRVLRNFRKDGHSWRKKKDGKNVGEAHEKLKVGNVDALNCYYAHGDQNPYFQRRIYWMLDQAYGHIVLVHYREVSEGRFLYGSMSTMPADSGSTFNQTASVNNVHYQGVTSGISELCEPSCSSGTVEEVSSEYAIGSGEMDGHLYTADRSGNSTFAPRPEVNQALRKLAEQLSLEDYDNSIYFGEKLPPYCSEYEKSQDTGIQANGTSDSSQESRENILNGPEFLEHGQIVFEEQDSGYNIKQASQSLGSGCDVERTIFPSWNQMLEISSSSEGINAHGKTSKLLALTGVNESSISKTSALGEEFSSRNMLTHDSPSISKERETTSLSPFGQSEQFTCQPIDPGRYNADNSKHQNPDSDLSLQLSAARQFLLGSDNPIDSPTSSSQYLEAKQDISGNRNCEANLNVMNRREGNSIKWMGSTELHDPNSTYSSDFQGMWFDQDNFGITLGADLGLTVAQMQRFSIHEISPEWAFSSESTKVIITGDFLCDSSECLWAVMFGDIEVSAEIVQEGVLRCYAPPHDAGIVQICITSGNRESCSEVREFEFVSKPTTFGFAGTFPKMNARNCAEEQLLLVKLVHMLLYGSDGLPTLIGSNRTDSEQSKTLKIEDRWSEITEALLVGSEVPSGILDWIMHELLKDKLQQWLSSKYQGSEEGVSFSSKQEHGIIHMISGLGYDWALKPILHSGVSINFRDANGWTALHWAARFGREEMVAALLAAGASARAVTDPTPQDPVGKTAGAIAAASGHTGLAGYLSEVDLTSHLLSLTMEENEISKVSGELEAERAVESISQKSVQMYAGGTEDELSLKDSLAAVRNAAQAAARIQAAFRAHSFRRRRETSSISEYAYGLTPEDIHGLSASSKFLRPAHTSRDQKFDKAALSIQKKYRGWKGRKDFLTLRQNVVKIQAHVRGHQERKKYKEFVWTVSVVEKVILRWRRKGVGLRGFRAEPDLIDVGDEEEEDIVKVFRKQKVEEAVDQAVSRVLSVVESPTARQQYRRMLERYRLAKAGSGTSDEAVSRLHEDYEIIESDDFMH